MKKVWIWCSVIIVLLLACLSACAEGDAYTLAAQDRITVVVLRHETLSASYTVPPDGVIDFPRAGRIAVAGSTTAEVAAILTKRLSQFLREPQVSVTLAEARRQQAYVLGAVARPGPYPVTDGARVTELLAAAGDLVGNRDKVTVALVRGAESIPVALTEALAGRDPAANPPVRGGDVLWVQAPEMITVFISGPVKTPGALKLEKGARLLDALVQAGDIQGERDKLTAGLLRGKTVLPIKLQAALAGVGAANPVLDDGDHLLLQAPVMMTVIVAGAVHNPGAVKLDQGARLLDALAAADDLSGEREQLTASLQRARETTPLLLQEALSGKDPDANIALADGDMINVQEPVRVAISVSGEVRTPGVVRVNEGEATVVSVLAQVGGLTVRPERARITLLRAGTRDKLAWDDRTHKLQDGDAILVEPEAVVRIFINGHVRNPGAYDLLEGGGVLEAIALAGGVLDHPALGQVAIMRRNGAVETVNLVSALVEGRVETNPKLATGDQVIVPESTARIAVLGMVQRAGTFVISDSTPVTTVDAISLAGGATKRARLAKVVVIRTRDGKPERLAVDVNAVLHKGQLQANIRLLPNDIVFVPETENIDWSNLLTDLSRVGILAATL